MIMQQWENAHISHLILNHTVHLNSSFVLIVAEMQDTKHNQFWIFYTTIRVCKCVCAYGHACMPVSACNCVWMGIGKLFGKRPINMNCNIITSISKDCLVKINHFSIFHTGISFVTSIPIQLTTFLLFLIFYHLFMIISRFLCKHLGCLKQQKQNQHERLERVCKDKCTHKIWFY